MPNVGPSGLTLTASAAGYSGNDNMTLSGTFTNNSPQESLSVSIDWGDGSPATTFSLDPEATSFQYPAQQYPGPGPVCDHRHGDRCQRPLCHVELRDRELLGPASRGACPESRSIDDHAWRPGQPERSASPTRNGTIAHTLTIHWGDAIRPIPPLHSIRAKRPSRPIRNLRRRRPIHDRGHRRRLDGSSEATSTISVTPTVEIDGPDTGNEGDTINFTSTITEPGAGPFTYAWVVTNSESGDEVASGDQADLTLSAVDAGSYEVSLVVADEDGISSDPVTQTVEIANVPPTVVLDVGGGRPRARTIPSP